MDGLAGAVVRNRNIVSFSGMGFLFCFLPLFFVCYYITPPKYRNIVLLLGSLLFYAMGEPYFVLLLLVMVWLNYMIATKLWNDGNTHIWKQKRRKQYLTLLVLLDAGMLAAFKLLHVLTPSFMLPLGISFFTFKMISYQVDAFRGSVEKPGFVKTAAYFTMFAQITSGPIMRYGEARGAFETADCSFERFDEGLRYFILGLSAKLLLADKLAILWNDIQAIGFESISTPLAWLGAAAFSLNLYLDFAGYSLMAGGIGVMLGYPMIWNFHHPYAARSIRDFWHRWHVTLGSWFRDYVYIPLGGSREGLARTVGNLFVVWLLTGLWHGSGWNFLLWGMVLFALIVLEKCFLGKWLDKYQVLSRGYVLLLMPLTWMIFAITDIGELGVYFTRLFPFFGTAWTGVNANDFMKSVGLYGSFLGAGTLLCVPAVTGFYQKHRKHILMTVFLAALFFADIYTAANSANNPFLYLDF